MKTIESRFSLGVMFFQKPIELTGHHPQSIP
jgi:hypothetical protein